jgi:hypothetical protein
MGFFFKKWRPKPGRVGDSMPRFQSPARHRRLVGGAAPDGNPLSIGRGLNPAATNRCDTFLLFAPTRLPATHCCGTATTSQSSAWRTSVRSTRTRPASGNLLRVFFSLGLPTSLAELVTLAKASNACCTLDAWDAQATHAAGVSSRGGQIYLASVFKFCTMAARWNSSRAPERPRNRIRSKPWCVFTCAKRISTFLRSLRDLANSGVPIKAQVTSRASSCTSRGIFRKVILGVHLGLSGHEPQSRVLVL